MGETQPVGTSISLCRGIYRPTSDASLPAVRVLCEVVALNGSPYAWIDGLSYQNPILFPVTQLNELRSIGTLKSFLADEKNEDLPEFELLLDIVYKTGLSATVTARALEIMHDEGLGAEQAIKTATQWGMLLSELDAADRLAHEKLH